MKGDRLHLGAARGGKPFHLPTDAATATSAVLGIRGSGKTTTATVLVEELLERGHQTVILDPTDVWWGLRSRRDGAKAGYPIVLLGGSHGDLPLDEGDGRAIADFLVDERLPAVLSMRHLRKGAQRRLVTEFAEQLYHRKGEAGRRTPLLLVIDEADAFVPQRVGGAEARMVGAIEDVVRRGRASGLGVILISQRAASVNKDVLTQIELLVAHRHTSPQDRKALEAWIEAHDTEDRHEEFIGELASLPRGTAWFWSPGLDVFEPVQVRDRRTFDSSSTPKLGQEAATPRKLAEVDLQALKTRLSATIERARADDPKALRAQVAKLERQLAETCAKMNAPFQADQAEVRRIVRSALREAEAKRLARLEAVRSHAESLLSAASALSGLATTLLERLTQVAQQQDEPASPEPPAPVRRPRRALDTRPQTANEKGLGKAERRILAALAPRAEGLLKVQIAILAGYSHKGGGFNNALSRLRTAGFVADNGPRIVITPAGRENLGRFDPLPVGRELLRYWTEGEGGRVIGKAGREVLKAVVEAGGRSGLPKENVARACGYEATGGGFNNALSRLRTLDLIAGRGDLVANPLFFERGAE